MRLLLNTFVVDGGNMLSATLYNYLATLTVNLQYNGWQLRRCEKLEMLCVMSHLF